MEPAPAPPTDLPPTPPLYWLFVLCALLTVGVWVQIVYDFFRQNASNLYGGFPAEVYLLMLGAYGGTKAVKRAAGAMCRRTRPISGSSKESTSSSFGP